MPKTAEMLQAGCGVLYLEVIEGDGGVVRKEGAQLVQAG